MRVILDAVYEETRLEIFKSGGGVNSTITLKIFDTDGQNERVIEVSAKELSNSIGLIYPG